MVFAERIENRIQSPLFAWVDYFRAYLQKVLFRKGKKTFQKRSLNVNLTF